MLKTIRISAALVLFALITFYFIDFAELLPLSFHYLADIQFVPALLSLNGIILAALLLGTLLFGRIYCSVICPLGIYQDAVGWISRRTRRKKKKYTYSKAKTGLRFTVLTVTAVTFFLGLMSLLTLLDPYSAYGRMATNVFKPLYLLGNNLLETIFTHFNNYTFYKMDAGIISIPSFVVAISMMILVGGLAWKYGRTWCNTVCPVGTLLGVLSRYSVFKIRIQPDKCNHCRKCASQCKASCIDSQAAEVDHSHCVTCFNCLNSCKQNALSYSVPSGLLKNKSATPVPGPDENSRRQFLTLTVAAATTSMAPRIRAQETIQKTLASAHGVKAYQRNQPITPPGSQSRAHFSGKCTGCHLCVSKCPTRILKPAVKEYGFGGFLQPVVHFKKGFCNFDCTICSRICPNGALLPLTKEEKHLTQIGYVVLLEENCIVYRDGTNCGACSEHCPTQAIAMIPYENGLTVPKVNTDICVGCGGCEYVCPAEPFKAVYVEGNPVHKEAHPFMEQESHEVQIEGFGF